MFLVEMTNLISKILPMLFDRIITIIYNASKTTFAGKKSKLNQALEPRLRGSHIYVI